MFKLLVIFAGMTFLTGTIKAESIFEAAKKVTGKITAKKIDQKICPLMGGKINPELYYKYKNTKIYVCCAGCTPVVKKNPEKYLKKVQKNIEAANKKKSVK